MLNPELDLSCERILHFVGHSGLQSCFEYAINLVARPFITGNSKSGKWKSCFETVSNQTSIFSLLVKSMNQKVASGL